MRHKVKHTPELACSETGNLKRLCLGGLLLFCGAAAQLTASTTERIYMHDGIPMERTGQTSAPVSRGPLDNYWGHDNYPYYPDRAGKNRFLTRIDVENNGVPASYTAVTYDNRAYPTDVSRYDWNAAGSEWALDYRNELGFDAEGRIVKNGQQQFRYDEHGRMAVTEYLYPEYIMRYTYEYDETGRRLRLRCDIVRDGVEEPYDDTVYKWTEADGVVTMDQTLSFYDDEAKTWTVGRRIIERTFDTPEGGWEETRTYEIDQDGALVLDRVEKMEFVRLVPGMVNGVSTSSRNERRIAGEMRVVNESVSETEALGGYKFKFNYLRMEYNYYSDGTLSYDRQEKAESVMEAYNTVYGWYQNTLSYKSWVLNGGEWEMRNDQRFEYNDEGRPLMQERLVHSIDGTVSGTKISNAYDDRGRIIESLEEDCENGVYIPDIRYTMTYEGDGNSYKVYSKSYYDAEGKSWKAPTETYEYEWDVSVHGSECYDPVGGSLVDFLPVSRKLTKIGNDGNTTVSIERYTFLTAGELGGIGEVAADDWNPRGPVTVYSLSGSVIGTYDGLSDAALPSGFYIVRQGNSVRKVFAR